jgi:cell division inhibitor SulA/protein ImuA
MSLEELMQRAELWRGGSAPAVDGVSSGYPPLDGLLGGGWPRGALTEILIDHVGIGELSLLLPTLVRLTREQRWLAFVSPPYVPYAPALMRAGVNLAQVLLVHPGNAKDIQWTLEQSLRAGTCGAVLAWLDKAHWSALRRLQLAAEAGGSLAFVYRHAAVADQSSPAALRLRLQPRPAKQAGVGVQIIKRRGGWPGESIELEVSGALAGVALP